MKKCINRAVICLLLLFGMGSIVSAQETNSFRIGSFHSAKGFGVCYEQIIDEYNFDSFCLYADMGGVLIGEHSTPGIKFNYTRDIVFKTIEREDKTVSLYAGPGLCCGYISDFKSPKSITAGIHGTVGAFLSYGHRLELSFNFSLDLAFKLIKDDRRTILSLYDSGLLKPLLPEIKILYRFK